MVQYYQIFWINIYVNHDQGYGVGAEAPELERRREKTSSIFHLTALEAIFSSFV